MNIRGFFRLGPTRGIPTFFMERKATAAAAYLLQKVAGQSMRYIRLLKLLYMADRESWNRYGRSITGDKYVSMDKGAVPSRTYDLIKAGAEPVQEPGPWLSTIKRVGQNDVGLHGKPDLGPLSQAEREILDEVHSRYVGTGTWDLIDHLHEKLAEWKDPKGSSTPIEPETILRALGHADEIDSIREDLEQFYATERLLGAH